MFLISLINYDESFTKALEDIKNHWAVFTALPVVAEDDIYKMDKKEAYLKDEVNQLQDFEK